jgi:hypothetical protein
MLFAVSAACVFTIFTRMRHMAVRRVSMMRRLLMIPRFVVLRGLRVMARGVTVVFGGFLVMFGCGF